ncbi:MAG: hypothetical protein ACQES1_08575, partial [Bacteroidota bacterium]
MIHHFGIYYKKDNEETGDILSAMQEFTDRNDHEEIIKKNINNLCLLIKKQKHDQTSYLVNNNTFISYSGSPYLSTLPKNDGEDLSGQILKYIISNQESNISQNLDSLKGSYNLTLYDTVKNKLFITSDVFGFYPLFYYNDERIFAFCNEYQPLLKLKNAKMPNAKAFAEYLILGHTQNRHTLLKNIHIIRPNCRMKISSKQNPTIKYFNKIRIKALDDPVEKLAHDYFNLFKKEVDLMLKWHPDMPVTLTGGTDTR